MRLAALAGIAVLAAACGATATTLSLDPTPAPEQADNPQTDSTSPTGTEVFVVHVDDGDSLLVEINGREERVRLIGVNAPEHGECLGDVARQTLTHYIEGTTVTLESDAEDTDQFGRLLRYVWLDGLLLNEFMAEEGLVVARGYEPNLTRQSDLDAAQQRAQDASAGMWAQNSCGTTDSADIGILAIQSNPPGPDEDDLNGEFVIFENQGSSDLDLSGYVLRDDSSGNRYTIPDGFVVPGSGRFVVFVGCGTDTAVELFWCNDGPVWSNSGDEVFLTDPNGNIVVYEAY
jgi:micrococcal nuclease